MTSMDDEIIETDGFSDLFQDPEGFYAPDKQPTTTSYTCRNGQIINLRLVGYSPLWAHHLWNAGQIIAAYLEDNAAELVVGKTVLELGAGAGLPSLISGMLGASKVVVTDYPEASLIQNLNFNIQNCDAVFDKNVIVAEGFLWGNSLSPLQSHLTKGQTEFDLLILADVVFNHSEHQKLVRTVKSALKKDKDARALVYFTPYRPWLLQKDLDFFRLLTQAGMVVMKISEQVMEKVMFENDPGDELLRRTVFGYEMTHPGSATWGFGETSQDKKNPNRSRLVTKLKHSGAESETDSLLSGGVVMTDTTGNMITQTGADIIPIPLLYSRQHNWGDKLLRKLDPDQIQQYLAEQPYTASTLRPLSGSPTLRDKIRVLATKAVRHSKKSQDSLNSNSTTGSNDMSDDTYKRGNNWVVPGVGEFTTKVVFTFEGNTLPAGLVASDNDEQQGSAPFPFRFDAGNVTVSGGTLNLRVPGGQDGRKKPISCAEVTTTETTILHASVRMNATLSNEPGVCHGAFFYRNDQAESDIEYLTDPRSKSNRSDPDVSQVWYSNQSTSAGGQPTHQSADPPPRVEGYHAYRLDWSASFTAYYVDGQLQSKLATNVPNKSGMWVWNNWCNGDQGWSCGPPLNDNLFRIKDITMYYNTLNNQP